MPTPDNTYLFRSRRLHFFLLFLLFLIAAFMRWYRIDNCVMCGSDEWLALSPSFQFLDKVSDHGLIQAVGFEVLAAFPFADVGRQGPPFDYPRSLLLIPTLPYYWVIGQFDFPVSEGWYRFPGTLYMFPGVAAMYYLTYQLTRRHVTALFAAGLQATLLGYVVFTRFLVADGIFPFWFALAAGLWIAFLHDNRPRTRHFAYIATMLYASGAPEAPIGLSMMASLIGFAAWQAGQLAPLQAPLNSLKRLRQIFIGWPLLWLVGFYAFQVLVEIKLARYNPDMLLAPSTYLGRFFGRGSGEWQLRPERLLDWYFYPNISLAVIVTALLSLALLRRRSWWAVLAFGWLWTLFWLTMTLLVSNSSSNYIRIMPAIVLLSAAGLTAIYDWRPRWGSLAAGLAVAGNIIGVYAYPLLCPLPENQNVAQAVGYLVAEYGEEWGGAERIAFYFPSHSLYAYLPEGSYTEVGFVTPEEFDDCTLTPALDTLRNADVLFLMPPGYDTRQQITRYLDYAIFHDCEAERHIVLDAYARDNGYTLAGQIVSADGQVHANIWSRLPLELGQVSIEDANRLHEELYSRRSWFKG